jgi:hypothetical protein
MPVPKRVEDLPHFQLRSLSSGRRLQGRFNRTAGVREGRCWLLAPERECLLGDLTSFDPATGDAVFESADAVPPELPGASLPYVDGYWQAYHVWMVAEPLWQWRRVPMLRCEVESEVVPETRECWIEGKPVQAWLRIWAQGKREARQRYCPLYGGDIEQQKSRIIAAGWNHEHCELCNAHIHAGDHAFVDPGEHWDCEACHARFVVPHDLSFLDA